MDGRIEVVIADQNGGKNTVVDVPIQLDPNTDRSTLAHLARAVGKCITNSQWLLIEAIRVRTDENLGVFSVYDFAREFFGMLQHNPLSVGQMPAFRIALALNLAH